MQPNTSIDLNNIILIKTSDNQTYTLPQWKVEESRLIHRKQELQKAKEKYYGTQPATIVLKTICSKKLILFSEALDPENFDNSFKNLDAHQRHLLICVAGEQELDSPILTNQLINFCFDPGLVKNCIDPHLAQVTIHNYLKQSLITHNSANKYFVQTTSNYVGHSSYMARKVNGHYNIIPRLALAYYDGYTSKKFIQTSSNQWLFNLIKTNNNNPNEEYFITAAEPWTKNIHQSYTNKQNIWLKNHQMKHIILKKNHTNSQ